MVGDRAPDEPPGPSIDAGLRARGMRSALLLSGREGIGMAIRLVGVIVLTRLIGPAEYGMYAGSVAIVFVLTMLAQMGTEKFLVRQVEELTPRRCHEVFTYLLVAAGAMTGVALGVSFLIGRLFDVPVGVFQLLLLSLPASILWAPAQALLERSFRFGQLGALELGGDILLYAVALPLAAAGFGASGAAIGFVCWQVYLLVGSYILAPYRPGLAWSSDTNRDVVAFGFGVTSAQLLRRGVELVNPLVVGPIGGAAMVGIVALAIRLIETISVVLRISARLTFAALSRVQEQRARFAAVLSEAMGLQTLALGALLGGFSLVIADALPILFGGEWSGVIDVLPWLAVVALLRSLTRSLEEGLSIFGRTLVIGAVELSQLVLLAVAAVPLVHLLGAPGFGLAALASLLPSIALDRQLRRHSTVNYAPSLLWVGAFAPLCFAPVAPAPWRYLLVIPAIVAALVPAGRVQISELLAPLRGRSSVLTGRRSAGAAVEDGGERG